MAKLKNPLFSQAASGALGGIEYRNGIYGPMCGRRSISTPQNTNVGLLRRSKLSAAHRAWESLTDDQRHAWSLHAKYPETGRNCFIGRWLKFTMAGITPLTIPLLGFPPDDFGVISQYIFLHTPGQMGLEWTNSSPGTDILLQYFLEDFTARSTPTLNKLRFYDIALKSLGYSTVTTSIIAPYYHLRSDQISLKTGDLISRHLYRFKNPGW